jgi:hypothetical protein
MRLLSFYFYFVKNAYLCFISSFSALHQFWVSLYWKDRLLATFQSMKKLFDKHVFSASLMHVSKESRVHSHWDLWPSTYHWVICAAHWMPAESGYTVDGQDQGGSFSHLSKSSTFSHTVSCLPGLPYVFFLRRCPQPAYTQKPSLSHSFSYNTLNTFITECVTMSYSFIHSSIYSFNKTVLLKIQ